MTRQNERRNLPNSINDLELNLDMPENQQTRTPLELGPESIDEGISSADDIYVPPESFPEPDSALKSGYEEPPETKDSDKAKSSPPRIDEWQDFFSRIVIRSACNYYIELAFRGIDEDLLTDREIERIKMQQDERDRIAKPFAEFCCKNKYMRRHGRLIIASGGMSDSLIALGMWQHRVNRIAKKYRTRTVKGDVYVRTGQSEQAQNPNGYQFDPSQRYYSQGG